MIWHSRYWIDSSLFNRIYLHQRSIFDQETVDILLSNYSAIYSYQNAGLLVDHSPAFLNDAEYFIGNYVIVNIDTIIKVLEIAVKNINISSNATIMHSFDNFLSFISGLYTYDKHPNSSVLI